MRERAGLGAVCCALAMACSGDTGARADGADAGERPAGASVYFVPPRRPTSEYAVTDVSWRVERGVARLDYTLPRLLVGASQRVSLEGPATGGVVLLTGLVGTASCTLQPSAGLSLRCEERFPGLAVDLDGVRREAMRIDPANVQARVDVATRFSIEPIGVLELASP